MRIASLAPSVTEIIYELGAEQDIVCSTVFCDYPEPAKSLPKIGSWTTIDIKKLESLNPDIVLTSSAVQGNLTRKLRDLGMNVVNINPMRLPEVVESYNQIGALVERRQEAENIVRELYKKIMAYTVTAQNSGPRVYCEEWSDPPMASGNWVPDVVELAGGVPGVVKAGHLRREYRLEDLQSFEPEIILLHICGMGDRVKVEEVMQRPGWEILPAIQSGEVHVLDDSLLNRPTRRLFKGLETLKEIIGNFKR